MRGTREQRRTQARHLWDEGPEAHEAAEENLDRVLGGIFVIVLLMTLAGVARLCFWS